MCGGGGGGVKDLWTADDGILVKEDGLNFAETGQYPINPRGIF